MAVVLSGVARALIFAAAVAFFPELDVGDEPLNVIDLTKCDHGPASDEMPVFKTAKTSFPSRPTTSARSSESPAPTASRLHTETSG